MISTTNPARAIFLYALLLLSLSGSLTAQCTIFPGGVYTSANGNESGTSITTTPENDGLFIAGNKNDSLLILRTNLSGDVVWSKTFDVLAGDNEFSFSIMVDSDGMLVIGGITGDPSLGGRVFMVRYDPANHIIMWAKFYDNGPNNYAYAIVQKGTGNYVFLTNPHFYNENHLDTDIVEIDKNTGDIVPAFAIRYTFFGTEGLYDMIYDGNFLYAIGRYKDGALSTDFRSTIAKLNPNDGSPVWFKFGHIAAEPNARLYGSQLLGDGDHLISAHFGDPAGNDFINTALFLQKSTKEGEVIWTNQYDLEGTQVEIYELIKSGEGYVVLASHFTPEKEIVMFKIDTNGAVLWSNRYEVNGINEVDLNFYARNRLVELDGQLYFTASGISQSGSRDLILFRTDLNGNVDMPCFSNEAFLLPVIQVPDPAFYDVFPFDTVISPTVESILAQPQDAGIELSAFCSVADTLYTTVEATICDDENFEGYSQSGTYVDVFVSSDGCDSIRTLLLTVNVCTPECGNIIGPIYSALGGDERGYSLASIPGDDDFYVAAGREDSVLLMHIRNNGEVAWSRTFDIRQGVEDNVFSLIVDSDNHLVMSGISGDPNTQSSVFVAKYDPATHQVLWINSIANQIRSYNFAIVQKSPGGNYVISNNPHSFSNNDAELLEINKDDGSIVSSFAKDYNLGSSDNLVGITVHEGFIYGTGRFTHEPSPFGMRHVIMKLDAADGTPVWTKLGHRPQDVEARLYGTDLIIDNNFIYSVYSGDPDGSSQSLTDMYIQKTSLEGELIWLKQYPIAGSHDVPFEILASNGGYVVLAKSDLVNNDATLFKINSDGEVMWGKRYFFPSPVPEDYMGLKSSQLIQAGNKLVFTAFTTNIFGENDLLIVRTDLNGNADMPCVNVDNISIDESDVPDPVFYDVTVEVTDEDPLEQSLDRESISITVSPIAECIQVDTSTTFLFATICNGDILEGYTLPGIYTDTFDIEGDCDSVRVLTLTVIACEPVVYYDLDACRSFMADGSHMDFSEFTPQYPVILSCTDLDAGNVHLIPSPDNKHSCTPGVNGSVAMCVGVPNTCTYQPGHPASVIFEMNVDPVTNGVLWITGLEFYEKSPATYNWIDGPSGPNNYPQFYGIRILKDGVEIFRQENVSTSANWTLEEYSFLNDPLFRFAEAAVLRFELFPYCPIGNGAVVSAWDLDEIRVFGACAPSAPIHSSIYGNVTTKLGQQVSKVKMYLGSDPLFHERTWTYSDEDGYYEFDQVITGQDYYAMGYNNDDILNGVSTIDMLLIQKHILGKQLFRSLDQYVAADINRSGRLSALDLVELRKTLLGKRNDFPNNRSWRIGSPQQDFNSTDPLSFYELITIEYLDKAPLQLDFLGIKVGDVNGDIVLDGLGSPLTTRNNKSITLSVKEQMVEADIPFVIEVIAGEDIDAEGLQWALNCSGLSLLGITGQSLPVEEEHFSFLHNDELRMSWSAAQSKAISKGDVLFTVELISTVRGYLSELISITESIMKPEMYTAGQVRNIELEFDKPEIGNATSGYCHVSPNPFSGETRLRFYLPEGGETRISFYTLSGELIHSMDKIYTDGEHIETITTQQLSGATGVIVCQLLSKGYTSVQKIVHLP